MVSNNGYLLTYLKYGDYDAILHVFTKEAGFQSFFVKGIYGPKNKKKAYLTAFNELNFIINQKNKGNISTVSRLELKNSFDFHNDFKANAILFFVADFLNQILKNEASSLKTYTEIENFRSELNAKNYQSHLIFLFKILEIQGFSPLENDGDFLNPETGTFAHEIQHQLFNQKISAIWKNLISAKSPYETKIKSKLRRDFLDSLLVYYHYHFTDFRTPKSLEIVQQIFE